MFLAESLALVPLGLTPVAIFPPFAQVRTVPAVAVIFSENPTLKSSRKKRWASNLQETSLGFRFSNLIKSMIKTLHKNMQCLIPRLNRRFGRKPVTVDSSADCFEVSTSFRVFISAV
jgi:hypothetical protein